MNLIGITADQVRWDWPVWASRWGPFRPYDWQERGAA